MLRLALAASLLLSFVALAAAEEKLETYAWLAGRWVGEMPNGDQLEEVWTPPCGQQMVGMFRWANKAGDTKMLEILAAAIEEGKLTLRVRHFDAQLKAREEKDKPVVFRLTEGSRSGKLHFVEEGKETKLTYEKTGDDSFSATLDFGGGRPGFTMKFTRAK